jgi:RHS repeat-associated protein
MAQRGQFLLSNAAGADPRSFDLVCKTFYVYGLDLLYEVDGAGATKTYHADSRGSTAMLTADDGVTVTDEAHYTTYGAVARRTGATDTPFLFCGTLGVMTDPNGLLNMRARYYNPKLMRFVSADPIGFDGGLNWYAYCGGNPVSRTDASGLWFGIDDAIFIGGGALIGMGSKFVADWATGTPTTWQGIVGAAIGGAACGGTLLYTANPVLAGAAGGFAGNLATQGLNLATGESTEFSVGSLALDTGIGGLMGFFPGARIQGVTAGSGSSAAVFEQIVTKVGNGTISTITTETAEKMAVGAAVKYAVVESAILGSIASDLASQNMAGPRK